jgi:SecD/SecF fusion protein
MNAATLTRTLVALVVLGFAGYLALSEAPRLGLDLRGGTQITLETRDSPTAQANAESTDRALEVLNRRVNALGVSESTVVRSGDTRIIVELPGVQDPREAAEVLGQTAQLSFHPVVGLGDPEDLPGEDAEIDTSQPLTLPDEDGLPIELGAAALTGEAVADARAELPDQFGTQWLVALDFTGEGGPGWAELTGQAACAPPGDPARRVAILLDDQVISSPQVTTQVPCEVGIQGGLTQITGNFTQEAARELALLIRGGALPVPVEIIEQRTVGPTLGEEAIEASAQAALIGAALTILYIMVVYRLVGVLAAVALAGYVLISYSGLLFLDATLTLPGLAGFVLAIGIAVDANVLVYERAREEYAEGKGLRASMEGGFKNAWSAIIDSNVTTLIAAGLLFFLASGPVRGFGVTLAIGVLASMISALVVTRVLTTVAAQSGWVQRRAGVTGLAHLGAVRTWLTGRSFHPMRNSRRWLLVAVAAVVLSVAGIALRGLNFGVEFTGGRLIDYSTTTQVDVDEVRSAISDAGFPRAVVQTSGEDDVTVRTEQIDNDEAFRIQEAVASVGGETSVVSDSLIGPTLGDELRRNALIALGAALAVQLLYLAVRFRWTFGSSAVIAMAHDVVVLIGIFAWLGKPIDGVFLAALLTVIGYSINDSVVIFDRVRELWGARRTDPFPDIGNDAILQTVPRTVNTGLGALFILAALAVLGGSSLIDFAIALIIGIVVGTYSSSLVAVPLAIEFEKRSDAPPPEPKRAPGEARPVRQPGDSGAVV